MIVLELFRLYSGYSLLWNENSTVDMMGAGGGGGAGAVYGVDNSTTSCCFW
jgi:hypothetical protein